MDKRTKERWVRHVPWLTAGVLTVIVFGTIYGVVQQAQRNAADFPQVQAAEDTANQLNSGLNPHNITVGRFDISHSLGTFVVIYDKNGKPVAGTGQLNGSLPAFPKGALEAAKGKDYARVTWQPTGSLRFASVSTAAKDYYVMSARSLKEVERNEQRSLQLTAVGCVVALLVLLLSHSVMHDYWPAALRQHPAKK